MRPRTALRSVTDEDAVGQVAGVKVERKERAEAAGFRPLSVRKAPRDGLQNEKEVLAPKKRADFVNQLGGSPSRRSGQLRQRGTRAADGLNRPANDR
jgi:hypothetical protein